MDDSQPSDNTAPGNTSGAVVDITKRKERSFYGFEHFNEVFVLSENNDQLINKFDRRRWKKGKIIGSAKSNGYLEFRLFDHLWYVHRIVWLLYFKKWPNGELDHINGNRADNIISNLRDATHSENLCNAKKRSNNKSTQKCIYFEQRRGKWAVQVKVYYKVHSGGCFENFEDAIKVRDEMVNRLHGQFANIS